MKYILLLLLLLCFSNIYSQSKVTVNSDQTVSINGSKFFPISVYVQSDYAGIKNMGVNTASRPFCVNNNAFNQIVSNQLYCHYTAGLGCDFDNAAAIKARNSSAFTSSISQVKNSNYIFGYGLPDEPKSATGLSAADTQWAYGVFKAADPNHPVFLTDYASDISAYKNSADIFLNDEYPFNNAANPLYHIKTKMKNMQSQVAPKPVWLIIQTGSQFGMPTNAQIRAETYLSIAIGSTGIIFYSYDVTDAGGVHNIKTDGDPAFMKNLITELKNFSPFFLGTKNTNLAYTSNDIDAILRNYNGKSYLIAVNKSTSAKSITFTLNEFGNATATIVGLSSAGSTRTEQTRTVSSGSLSDTFQGLEAVVYEIGTACTVPGQPGQITGNVNVAAGSSQTYSIAAVSGATSYTWTLPAGWSGTSTSTSITVTTGSTGGTMSVKANNSCGAGSSSTLTVTVGTTSTNLATNKPTTTSSIEAAGFEGAKAVDGSLSTRWASAESDPQWIYVDLGGNYTINRVKISWEVAYGKNYLIQTSANASTWTTIKTVTGNTTTINDFSGLTGTGRYVRVYGTARGTVYGYSIYELEVYGSPSNEGFTSRIEAENYISLAGIQTESCSEGGLNVGYFDANDWIAYNITIPAEGTYNISYRVASIITGKTLRLEKDNGGTLLGTVNIPNTGGWQTWTTVSHNVTLPAGTYPIRITSYTGGLNLNWIEIANNLAEAGLQRQQEVITDSESQILLLPNPVEDQLFISGVEKVKSIKIYNLQGKIAMSIENPGNAISVPTMTTGLYVAIVEKQQGKIERIRFAKK
jgi:hypothetical protein